LAEPVPRRERVATASSAPGSARCDGGGGRAAAGFGVLERYALSDYHTTVSVAPLPGSDEGGGAARRASPVTPEH
jgi:hypothetical protein